MAESGSGGNRRHPQNMQGLLHLAIETGAGEQDAAVTNEMSEERRKWLQEAMSSAFQGQVDEVQQMKDCLADLKRGTEGGNKEAEDQQEEQERKERALEMLSDLCENMDNAADFCKLDGMRFLVTHYLDRPEAVLRSETAHLIGTCCQNVPFVQEHVLSLGAMGKLLRLLDVDCNEAVRIKALFAISCLVREQEAGLLEFLKLDGFSVLMRAMQSDVMKLKVKSAFLLQNLLLSHPEHKGALCSMGMIQQLVALLRTDHGPFHEHVLGALCSLVMDFPQGVLECRASELGFEELLKERCHLIASQEEFQEELEFCECLLRVCFQNRPDDQSMDR